MTKEKKKGFWFKFGIQVVILLVLFIIAEMALRVAGMQAGCLIDDFKIEENPVYQPRFVSDEVGINHIHSEPGLLMKGSVINEEGFRSRIAYTPQSVDSVKKTGKKVVMLIGDSFVEGCCADDVRNSFGDIINRDKQYEVLNFGVAGTDLVQYKLVAQKYAATLKPDRVVICFYMGNDIMYCDRLPTPGVPLTYPFKANKWIYSVPMDHLSRERNHVFKSADEAYTFLHGPLYPKR